MNKMKILSCFDGISACQVALKNLGIEYDYYASEIEGLESEGKDF
jgi:hypothetical protein